MDNEQLLTAIRQIVREEIREATKSTVSCHDNFLPLDPVHLVQQQALQLVREGKREESKALLKAYSQRDSIERREQRRKDKKLSR